jgi:hypothetical protein
MYHNSSVLLPVGYIPVGSPIKWSISRVSSNNLPFACQFPKGDCHHLPLLLRPSDLTECLGLFSSETFGFNQMFIAIKKDHHEA